MARLERIPVVRSRWLIVGFSALLILLSAALLFIKGFNLGIDFESGLSQRVQVAPSGLKVSFEGSQGAKLSVSDGHLVLEIRDSGGVKASTFALEGSVADLAKAMEAVDGIDVTVIDPSLDASLLITGFGFPATLTQSPFVLNFAASDGSLVTIDLVRKALSDLRNVKVQSVGEAIDQVYQIRIGLEDGADSQALEKQVSGMLDAAFGPDEVVTLESSYIGAKFSASLITGSLKAVGIAVALILVYVWLRFELAYAIGSV
ncbi:MAG: protein translocase subunit SecF, partial [Sphaerochaetaceae bacterium]